MNGSDYTWNKNTKGNFIAINTTTKKHTFTWQPNGAQFTIHKIVPVNASRYVIRKPNVLDEEQRLKELGYDKDWVHFFLEDNLS